MQRAGTAPLGISPKTGLSDNEAGRRRAGMERAGNARDDERFKKLWRLSFKLREIKAGFKTGNVVSSHMVLHAAKGFIALRILLMRVGRVPVQMRMKRRHHRRNRKNKQCRAD